MVAASYARWDLLAALVDAGVAVPTGGRTPLHLAAGAGELGADTTARDPEFDALPLDWARFLRQHHVAEWLEAHAND